MLGGGDYSRYGPWGGWDSLEPARDSGTFVFAQALVDGDQVGVGIRPVGSVTFTARNVPVGPEEFAVGPNAHTALAAAINAHPVIGQQYVATAGLTLSGQLMVEVESYTPSEDDYDPATLDDNATIGSLTPRVILYGVLPGVGSGPGVSVGVLMGGAKLMQSSMLAGGTRTFDHNNAYDPRLGMVALGGQPLPAGGEINLIFTPA